LFYTGEVQIFVAVTGAGELLTRIRRRSMIAGSEKKTSLSMFELRA
jgi:hypothetical protein